MVANYHGLELGLHELRGIVGGSVRGSTLDSLMEAASSLGLSARPLRASSSDVARLRCPAILHWKMDHFVVLYRVRRHRYEILDPARGKISLKVHEFGNCFTGIALELQPTAGFKSRSGNFLSLIRVARSYKNLTKFLSVMLFLLLTVQILAVLPTIVTQILIDEVTQAQDKNWLYAVIVGVFLLMTAGTLLDGIRKWVSIYAGARLQADSSTSVLSHLFRLPPQFVQNRLVGDLLSRLESLNPIRVAISEQSVNVIAQLGILAVTLTVMSLYSVTLSLLALASVFLSLLIIALFLPANRRLVAEQLIHTAKQNTSLVESLRAAQTVFSLGIGQSRLTQWQSHFHEYLDARFSQQRLKIVQETLGAIIVAADQALFLGIGINGVLSQSITLGVLFAFVSLRGRLTASAIALYSNVQSLLMVQVHTERLADIVLAKPVPAASAAAIRKPVDGRLSAQGLYFRYEKSEWVIADFDCNVAPGEKIAVIGPSGGGKTTLLKLLSGQLTPASGTLMYANYERSLWDAGVLRAQFGIVSQQDALFQGSIAENICGFDALPDLAAAQTVAQRVHLWGDIQSMPMRMHTLVGDMGNSLSGGQQQRLMLARALYRKPKILFLDEATSNLDAESESKILDELQSLGITMISVAHRSAAIQRADRVITIS